MISRESEVLRIMILHAIKVSRIIISRTIKMPQIMILCVTKVFFRSSVGNPPAFKRESFIKNDLSHNVRSRTLLY